MAMFSHASHRFFFASALAASFVIAASAPAVAGPNEVVIVNGAVTDPSSPATESRADHSIPMLPVVYDDPPSAKHS